MVRTRMRRIIRLLETNDFNDVKDEILAPANAQALNILIDTGCIDVSRAWGGAIVNLTLRSHSATYRLERHDVWINRLYGFICGVAVTVVAELLLRVIL